SRTRSSRGLTSTAIAVPPQTFFITSPGRLLSTPPSLIRSPSCVTGSATPGMAMLARTHFPSGPCWLTISSAWLRLLETQKNPIQRSSMWTSPNMSSIMRPSFRPRSMATVGSVRSLSGFPLIQPSRFISSICSRSEEHTSELQSPCNLVCRLLLEKKKSNNYEVWHGVLLVDCDTATLPPAEAEAVRVNVVGVAELSGGVTALYCHGSACFQS